MLCITFLQGTVQPVQHFDPAEDCRRLHKAMAGLGTNEKVIIEIIANRYVHLM